MKTTLVSLLSLLVGAALGFRIGRTSFDNHITNEAVKLMLEGSESSDAMIASLAMRSTQFITSGESNQAVHLLSGPIAHYYYTYDLNAGPNSDRRLKLHDAIEELARTNSLFAQEFSNRLAGYALPIGTK